MIYDINGDPSSSAFDYEGVELAQAYDIDGNELISTSNLVVMTYNVQWFSGLNGNQTMQDTILDTYKPDVIGFQEFQRAGSSGIPQMATTLLSADYPYIEMGNYGNKNALASKYAMSDFQTVPHTQQTMDGQSYSTATITVDGKDILLVVSHATTSDYEAKKVEQIQEMFNAVKVNERYIIMADFNTTCKSVNDTEYTTIMKQFIDVGCHVANCSPQWGFNDTWTSGSTTGGTWYPCDNIITSGNITMKSVVVDDTKISVAAQTGQSIDHLPIIAYLSI